MQNLALLLRATHLYLHSICTVTHPIPVSEVLGHAPQTETKCVVDHSFRKTSTAVPGDMAAALTAKSRSRNRLLFSNWDACQGHVRKHYMYPVGFCSAHKPTPPTSRVVDTKMVGVHSGEHGGVDPLSLVINNGPHAAVGFLPSLLSQEDVMCEYVLDYYCSTMYTDRWMNACTKNAFSL